MRSSQLLAILTISVLSIHQSFSQGIFLPKGESGLGAGFSFKTGKQATSTGVSGGYCVGGILDLGITVGRVKTVRSSTGDPITTERGTSVSPSLALYVLRYDSSANDVSIALHAAYEHESYSSADVPAGTRDIVSGGFTLFQDVLPSGPLKIEPILHLTVLWGEVTELRAEAGAFLGLKDWIGQITGLTIGAGYQSGMVFFRGKIDVVF